MFKITHRNEYKNNEKYINGDIIENDKIIDYSKKRKDIIGILYCSSKVKLGITKKNTIVYKFRPLDITLPIFQVSCKTISNSNKYAIVNFDSWNDILPKGALVEILGNENNFETKKKAYQFLYCGRLKKYNLQNLIIPNQNKIQKEIKNKEHTCITIDPKGCQDIDDGINLLLTDKHFNVSIYITDLIKKCGVLYENNETLQNKLLSYFNNNQPFTYYFDDKRYDCFPDNIVNYFSLFQGINHDCWCIDFKFNLDGDFVNYEISQQNVYVTENLSYDEYKLSLEQINILEKCFNKSQFKFEKKVSTKSLIEFFAIYSNLLIGQFCNENNILIPYRIQKDEISKKIHPKIKEIVERDYFDSAEYKFNSEIKHNYLDLKYYTHFTSPIRRKVDCYVHLMLYKYFNSNNKFTEDLSKVFNLECNLINNKEKQYKICCRELTTIKFNKNNNILEYFWNKAIPKYCMKLNVGEQINKASFYFPLFQLTFVIKFIEDDHLKYYDIIENDDCIKFKLINNDIKLQNFSIKLYNKFI